MTTLQNVPNLRIPKKETSALAVPDGSGELSPYQTVTVLFSVCTLQGFDS